MKNVTPLLVCALAASLLGGCGAVTNAVNSAIPEIDNVLALDGVAIDSTVGGLTRAPIVGGFDQVVEFADRELPQKDRLRFVRIRQSLDKQVQVSVPTGATLPAAFTVRNVTLRVSLTDGARSVSGEATIAGPLTYTRTGVSSTYVTEGDVTPEISFTSENFATFREIVTTAPTPNTATARLRFDAEDTELPAGSRVRVTLVDGKARVGI
jgi:hypothetical protein